MRLIMRLCERIQVLDYGKTISIGAPAQVRSRSGRADGLPRDGGRSMLQIDDLRVNYGRIAGRARDLAARRRAARLVAIVGPNGAGKTTTLSAIFGLVAPAGGSIVFEGTSLVGASAREDPPPGPGARSRRAAHLRDAERRREPPARHDRTRRDRTRRPRISSASSSASRCCGRTTTGPAATLSGGEQQQLAIARALLSRAAAAPARRAVARASRRS